MDREVLCGAQRNDVFYSGISCSKSDRIADYRGYSSWNSQMCEKR